MTPKDRRPGVLKHPRSEQADNAYRILETWLAEHPNVKQVLDRMQSHRATGVVSDEDVILIANKWRQTLPPARGVLKYLRDFMQLRLDLGTDASAIKRPRHRKSRNKRRLL
jgi:hypothetical protein